VAAEILNGLGFIESELSIVLVDDEEMARLNLQYRQVDTTTDVLAFPMLEGEFGEILPELLGDVVISAPTALDMSRRYHCSLPTIIDVLLVHGILHLLGYDHEHNEEEARRMDTKSLDLLEMLGHSRESLDWYRNRSDEQE
jgi:probable rRNA maturation factor